MMASCRECQKQVSSEALACPDCGAPWPAGSGMNPYPMERDVAEIRKEIRRLRLWLVTIILIFGVLFLLLRP
jgi:uncharacterized membrane protein YvbJ